ncbi:hypothetical protein ACGGZK_18120 [Agromyces sp. MMS24-K17]|uniref:hypothetical protein n=1 Tax=Agromyces sp. MMS24-K17 TaxID=3372850 RepID=UPI00375496AF
MTGTQRALPSRTSAGVFVVPAVTGILAALLLLALGRAPVVCAAVGDAACPTADDRFAVALVWTVIVIALASVAAVLPLTDLPRARTWSRVAYGALLAATLIGVVATLATGGFAIPLFYF